MTRPLVVIPCLNEEAHLPGLLAQMLADTPGASIVVADGGSTDRSQAIVQDFARQHANVHLLPNPKRIQSAGVNLAVARFGSDHDVLVRIDAHCRYPRGYVAGLLAAAREHHATSVVVPMITAASGCFQAAAAAAQNSVLGNGGSAHRRIEHGQFVDHGHHALFDLELYCRVGGYDEAFSHNEDAELDQRLIAAGGRIWLEPSLALDYWPRRTPAALFRQYRGYGRGRAMTIMRHRTPIKLRQAIPIAILPVVALAVLGLLLAAAIPAAALLCLPALGWAAASLGYGLILGLKARSACVSGAGWAAMISHFAWSLGFLRQRLFGQSPGAPPPPIVLPCRGAA